MNPPAPLGVSKLEFLDLGVLYFLKLKYSVDPFGVGLRGRGWLLGRHVLDHHLGNDVLHTPHVSESVLILGQNGELVGPVQFDRRSLHLIMKSFN